jgi:hypothetical protein
VKMDEEKLLDILNRKEERAGNYVWGQLGNERETSLREYYRLPYGNEEDGWSQIVSSDIQDTVEWILPALLKTFSSTDKAVVFEPSKPEDVKPAEQATDTVNYVFYKSNNGFLVLYNAFKDALTVRNCAVMWRKEDQETVSSQPFKGAQPEMLAMLTQDGSEITEANPEPMLDQNGQPLIDPYSGQQVIGYSGRLKKIEKKTVIKVEAFSPDDLLIDREWTSPLLADCPYVCRMMRVTVTDLKNMGFDVDPEDLEDSDGSDRSAAESFRLAKVTQADQTYATHDDDDDDDESMEEGWLRIEFVLVDVDGDGIAERHCIYRLKNKILKDEIVSHVPVATFSPVMNTHRWDGMSMADIVSDLQKLHTELLRQTLNNLYLTNNPRTKVLTDANWSPLANIDDLLDSRAGGIIRQRDPNAVVEHVVPFAAAGTMPMLEYVQGMRENRTGVSRVSMGLNPDSLNNTATGRAQDMSAAQQRVELIARIAAETLLKPIFAGILKLLTDGGMEKLAFRLRNEFVEYDPNEWRDQYDMTINVGLGTGDRAQQITSLQMILQNQVNLMPMGIANPANIYHTASKMVEAAGHKDTQNFLTDPSKQPPQPQQPPLPLQIEQMKIQADQQKHAADSQTTQQIEAVRAQAKQQEIQATLQLQAANDQRDADREMLKAQYQQEMERQRLAFDAWKVQYEAQVKMAIEEMKAGNNANAAVMQHRAELEGIAQTAQNNDQMKEVMNGIQYIADSINAHQQATE